MAKRIKILDVPFDQLTEKEAIELFTRDTDSSNQEALFVATPNPEMLIEAARNEGFKKLLNSTGVNIADGMGILWSSCYLSKIKPEDTNPKRILLGIKTLFYILFKPAEIRHILPERINGSTMMIKICENVSPNRKIFLLGGAEGIAEAAKLKLEKKYSVKICGTYSGSPDPGHDNHIINLINDCQPEILFVAYGSPKQEFWIQRNLPRLKTVRLAMGIGGAFDFIVGKRRRAPELMQKIGLEWLFRLIQEPSRIKRIFNATIKFPCLIIKSTLK